MTNTTLNKWQKVTLGQVLNPKDGYIRGPFGSALRRGELQKSGIPVYEQQNAIYNHRNFRFFIDDEKFNELKRFQVKNGDLIISCSGTLGLTSLIKDADPKGIISQALLVLRPDQSKILPEYLYQFFNSKKGLSILRGASHGSVQTNIAKRSVVESIEFDLPTLGEQENIAEVLSSFEKKIENNNRVIDILENMAQAIFKEWFKTGEKQKNKLADIAKIVMGQSPKSEYYNLQKEGLPFHQGVTNFGYRYPTHEVFSTGGEKTAENGDVLVSVRAPVGRLNIANTKIILGRGLAALRHKQNKQSFLFYLLKSIFTKEDLFGSGSVFPAITKKEFEELPVNVSEAALIDKFEQTVSPMDQLIRSLIEENQKLIGIRNILLPRLMSGKIKI